MRNKVMALGVAFILASGVAFAVMNKTNGVCCEPTGQCCTPEQAAAQGCVPCPAGDACPPPCCEHK